MTTHKDLISVSNELEKIKTFFDGHIEKALFGSIKGIEEWYGISIMLTKMSAGLVECSIGIVVIHLGHHPGVLRITWYKNL